MGDNRRWAEKYKDLSVVGGGGGRDARPVAVLSPGDGMRNRTGAQEERDMRPESAKYQYEAMGENGSPTFYPHPRAVGMKDIRRDSKYPRTTLADDSIWKVRINGNAGISILRCEFPQARVPVRISPRFARCGIWGPILYMVAIREGRAEIRRNTISSIWNGVAALRLTG